MTPEWLYLGVRYAHHFYNDFSDKTNQGSNFTWKNFPNLVSRLTKVQFFLSSKRGISYRLRKFLCYTTAWFVAYILSKGERYDEFEYSKTLYN